MYFKAVETVRRRETKNHTPAMQNWIFIIYSVFSLFNVDFILFVIL